MDFSWRSGWDKVVSKDVRTDGKRQMPPQEGVEIRVEGEGVTRKV